MSVTTIKMGIYELSWEKIIYRMFENHKLSQINEAGITVP